ncbi:sarcosine oxidase [Ruegeria halocynthiae]|uniref:Sarcosine oxidase n=1 Tax=Ruegeria halocynthiae TaxID=985054 RepID=A0A1H2YGZ0_9RHOB|nr:FAD-dependent oxidoreductase [Ruegeria halocynthiae]SDX04483.1 sarcosine oxidase [Ruegeria halocynthiae]
MTKPDNLQSIWSATASKTSLFPSITGGHKADVLVVGAGYTGLSCALALAEAGASVVVLDAEQPGFGASGRNGGQVIPGLKYDPDTIDREFGEASTAFVGQTADHVFDVIERYSIDCDASRKGWIQASLKSSHLSKLGARMEQWKARGVRAGWLDQTAISAKTGASGLVGGWLDYRAGCVHPLNYARGLARAASELGVRIFGKSRVTSLRREGQYWQAQVGEGVSILTDQIVLATNGYTDHLWPGLRATMVPANSFQVATVPLPETLLTEILPDGNVVSDSRRIANYFRIGPGNRLMIGGRGHFGEPGSARSFRRIEANLTQLFPQLRGHAIEHRWSGRAAMTLDSLPHVMQPAPGVTAALGYNGRGLAMGSALGFAIGRHLSDARVPLPLPVDPVKRLPVHGLHPIYGTAAILYYRMRDALEA